MPPISTRGSSAHAAEAATATNEASTATLRYTIGPPCQSTRLALVLVRVLLQVAQQLAFETQPQGGVLPAYRGLRAFQALLGLSADLVLLAEVPEILVSVVEFRCVRTCIGKPLDHGRERRCHPQLLARRRGGRADVIPWPGFDAAPSLGSVGPRRRWRELQRGK